MDKHQRRSMSHIAVAEGREHQRARPPLPSVKSRQFRSRAVAGETVGRPRREAAVALSRKPGSVCRTGDGGPSDTLVPDTPARFGELTVDEHARALPSSSST